MLEIGDLIKSLENRAQAAEGALADLLAERPDFEEAVRKLRQSKSCHYCRHWFRDSPFGTNKNPVSGKCYRIVEVDWQERKTSMASFQGPGDEYDAFQTLQTQEDFGCLLFEERHRQEGGLIVSTVENRP